MHRLIAPLALLTLIAAAPDALARDRDGAWAHHIVAERVLDIRSASTGSRGKGARAIVGLKSPHDVAPRKVLTEIYGPGKLVIDDAQKAVWVGPTGERMTLGTLKIRAGRPRMTGLTPEARNQRDRVIGEALVGAMRASAYPTGSHAVHRGGHVWHEYDHPTAAVLERVSDGADSEVLEVRNTVAIGLGNSTQWLGFHFGEHNLRATRRAISKVASDPPVELRWRTAGADHRWADATRDGTPSVRYTRTPVKRRAAAR